jgi:hypothetical protein
MTQRSQLGGGARLVSKKVQNRCHVSGHVLRPILLIGPTKILQNTHNDTAESQHFYVNSYRIMYLHIKS